MTTTLRARWLVPVAQPPIKNGCLTVHAGCIVALGESPPVSSGGVEDLGDVVLLPGFVNAHTHLELSCYRGRLAPAPLWDWFEQLVAQRRSAGAPASERRAVTDGATESLDAGVTCVGDISREGIHCEVLRSSPIRKVCFLELISGGARPPADAAALACDFDAAIARYAGDERLTVGLSPHAPYTVTRPDLDALLALAESRNAPWTMHLLETAEEAAWLADGAGPLRDFLRRHELPTAHSTGAGPIAAWIGRISGTRLRPLFAHVNYADEAVIDALAAAGASVVWCPRTHAFFGHPPHRWRDMLAAGVNVCVGTDSLASAPTLSVLEELRFCRRAAPDVPCRTLLEMGTVRPAVALQLGDRVGALRLGAYSDLTCVEFDHCAAPDPIANVLEGTGRVRGVWLGGDRVK